MLIKYQTLASSLQKKMHAVYVLFGQDHYLLNDAAFLIKKTWGQRGESDNKTLHINNPADWAVVKEEANSYSLFTDLVLLDIRCDKKTIDAAGKEILNQYLQEVNSRCLIMLRAPNVPAKQLQWLTNHEQVLAVQIYPLTAPALQSWIVSQLQSHSIRYEQQVPSLIHQYTQGNMLACAQVIEKVTLIHNINEQLTVADVLTQLVDQCEYQLYDLADACLAANPEKAIHLLRQARNQQTEPTLILWLFAQEIRLLIQLSYLLKQAVSFTNACTQLKIWPQRAKFYQLTVARLSLDKLYQLLQISKQLDERIKSNNNHQIWQAFEQLALTICLP